MMTFKFDVEETRVKFPSPIPSSRSKQSHIVSTKHAIPKLVEITPIATAVSQYTLLLMECVLV